MKKQDAQKLMDDIDKKVHEMNCQIFDGADDAAAKKFYVEIENLTKQRKELVEKFKIKQLTDW